MAWDKMTLSNKVLQATDDVVTHPIHEQYYREVHRLVVQLRLSNTFEQLYVVQKRLLSAIQHVEGMQQQLEDQITSIKVLQKDTVVRGNKAGSPRKVKLWELRKQETECSREVEVYKQVRRELRSVGDGLLWKAVGYSRGYITGVSDAPGEGNRHLSDSEGLEAELSFVENYFETGAGLAVLHDLTNIGRVGDLTLVSPDPKHQPQAIEVKRSGPQRNKRTNRQQDRLRQMQQFVQGLPVTSEDGHTKLLRVIDAPLEHHLKQYGEVLFEATTKGAAAACIEDYLGILAVNTLHPKWKFLHEIEDKETREQLSAAAFGDILEPIVGMYSGKDSVIMKWDSIEKEFSLLENRTSGAPFSIYPFHPQVSAALICGYTRLFVFCDLNALTRRFQNEGLQVDIESESVGTEQIFSHIRLSRPKLFRDGTWGRMSFGLSKSLMQQVLGEGMAFKTLVNDIVKPSFRGRVKEQSTTPLAFTNEAAIWDKSYIASSYMKPGTEQYGRIEI